MFGKSIHLIAMTGYGQPDDVHAALEAGFDRHLTKPVDFDRLYAALKAASDTSVGVDVDFDRVGV